MMSLCYLIVFFFVLDCVLARFCNKAYKILERFSLPEKYSGAIKMFVAFLFTLCGFWVFGFFVVIVLAVFQHMDPIEWIRLNF